MKMAQVKKIERQKMFDFIIELAFICKHSTMKIAKIIEIGNVESKLALVLVKWLFPTLMLSS